MSKTITWRCDQCKRESSNPILPSGWLETSFFMDSKSQWYRYCFCSYHCLSLWSEKQIKYYGMVSVVNITK